MNSGGSCDSIYLEQTLFLLCNYQTYFLYMGLEYVNMIRILAPEKQQKVRALTVARKGAHTVETYYRYW